MLHWPSLRIGEFHLLIIDGDIHTIVERSGDDKFLIVKEGNSEPERVHIDWIAEEIHGADEVTLKKR